MEGGSIMKLGRLVWLVAIVCVVNSIVGFDRVVEGAGECGKSTTPDMVAFRLAPCAEAAQDEESPVSYSCCVQIKRIGQNPSCLCAAMLSDTAKAAGINPEIAITIPKRCNIVDRPIGYKCGPYILPSLPSLEMARI